MSSSAVGFNPFEWEEPASDRVIPTSLAPQPDWPRLDHPQYRSLNQALSSILAARNLKPSDISRPRPLRERASGRYREWELCLVCMEERIYDPADSTENAHKNTVKHLEALADALAVDRDILLRFRKQFFCHGCKKGFISHWGILKHQCHSKCFPDASQQNSASALSASPSSSNGEDGSSMNSTINITVEQMDVTVEPVQSTALVQVCSETAGLANRHGRGHSLQLTEGTSPEMTSDQDNQDLLQLFAMLTLTQPDSEAGTENDIAAQLQAALERLSLSSAQTNAIADELDIPLEPIQAALNMVYNTDWTRLKGDDLITTIIFWLKCQEAISRAKRANSVSVQTVGTFGLEGDQLISYVVDLLRTHGIL